MGCPTQRLGEDDLTAVCSDLVVVAVSVVNRCLKDSIDTDPESTGTARICRGLWRCCRKEVHQSFAPWPT